MMDEDRLCLKGDLAEPFMKHKIGDRVPIHLDAVLIRAEMRDEMQEITVSQSDSKKKPPPKQPYVEFVLRSVNGKMEDAKGEGADEDHDYKNMSSEKFEKRVAKNRGY